MNKLTRVIAIILTIALCLAYVPAVAEQQASEPTYPWQILSTSQHDEELWVTFLTDRTVSGNLLFQYGNVSLEPKTQPEGGFGIGYVFVIDWYRGDFNAINPRDDLMSYAISKMSSNDRVAFVTPDGNATSFVAKSEWQSAFDSLFGKRNERYNIPLFTGIGKALELCKSDTARPYHSVIVYTTHQNNASTSQFTAADLQPSFIQEQVGLYILIGGTYAANWVKEIIEFGNSVTANGSSLVTKNTYKSSVDIAMSATDRVYRQKLKLTPDCAEQENARLTISTAGGTVWASSKVIQLNHAAIPTWTPEPTPEPTETPEPEVTPTPLPYYIGEEAGSMNQVAELQELLQKGNFYTGEIDGRYDLEVERAVTLFYKVNGMEDQRPEVGGITKEAFDKLQSGKYTPNPTEAPTQEPVQDPNRAVIGYGIGDSNAVMDLCDRLKKLYYYEGDLTATYNDALESAVRDFCWRNSIEAPTEGTGINQKGLDLLQGNPIPKPTDTPAPIETPDPNAAVVGFDHGTGQQKYTVIVTLKRLYYLEDGHDTYDATVEQAVRAFCEDNGFAPPNEETGLTQAAYDFLTGDTVQPRTTEAPTPEPTEDPNRAYIMEGVGTAADVRELKSNLRELNYYTNSENTKEYTEELDIAVGEFLEAAGFSRPTEGEGITKEAFEFLKNMSSQNRQRLAKETPVPTESPAFWYDAQTSSLWLSMWNRLVDLGYIQDATNYSPSQMADAVNRFCTRNDCVELQNEQFVSSELYNRIMREDAIKAEDDPVPLDPNDPEPEPMAMEQIKALQDKLRELQYFRDVDATYTPGVLDEATLKAYVRFCEVNGLTYDGKSISWASQAEVLRSTEQNPDATVLERTRSIVTGSYNILGMSIPTWVLFVVGAVLLAAIIITVVLIKRRRNRSSQNSSYTSSAQLWDDGGLNVSTDAPTDDMSDVSSGISITGDLPTVADSYSLTLLIKDGNGYSTDHNYGLNDGERLIVGRGSDADIRLDATDLTISRKHGYFRIENKALYFGDTSSRYSIVAGEQVHNQERALSQGCEIAIGKSILIVQWS